MATAQTPNSALWGISYVYDAWANLTNMNAIPGKTGGQNLQEAPASSKNQLPGFSYDAAGNLLTDGVNTYTYDAENRIKTAAGVTYTYDGDDLRVAKSNGRLYWRGMSIGPLTVTDATGALIHEFVYLNGRRVGFINSVGNRYYFWSDHLGSATVVSNAQGAIKEESDFYPFGGERIITDTLDNRFKFTGQEFDPGTANYAFPFRFQSTRLGRFLSPDPVEGDPSNPQSWNRYAYVMNGPLSLLDPLGLASSPLNCDTHPAEAGGNCVVAGGLLGGSWASVDGVDTPPSLFSYTYTSNYGGAYSLVAGVNGIVTINEYNGEELLPEAAAELGTLYAVGFVGGLTTPPYLLKEKDTCTPKGRFIDYALVGKKDYWVREILTYPNGKVDERIDGGQRNGFSDWIFPDLGTRDYTLSQRFMITPNNPKKSTAGGIPVQIQLVDRGGWILRLDSQAITKKTNGSIIVANIPCP